MRNFARYTLTIGAAALFVGCGGSQPPIGAPGAMPQVSALAARTNSKNYKVVYSFGAPPDGGCPHAGLIDVGGTLYGTTTGGGAYASGDCSNGVDLYGTVFSFTTSGTENVLHSFPPGGSKTDGSLPEAGLINVHGTLYGTTWWGGAAGGHGTVFSITTSGTENLLHSFDGKPDGANPAASLVELKGKLYGTTSIGGKHVTSGGTFFSLTTGGTEKLLHYFGGRQASRVVAGLIDVGGALYGTSERGGAYYKGVVFSITPSGREKVLHSFGNGTDGAYPYASLIEVNGTLYGTTEVGGTYKGGTVFSIAPSGTEEVLHSFGYGTDGARPTASLIDVNGTLYGTTSEGGSYECGRTTKYFNCGTVFSITPAGAEKVLHSFRRATDGVNPAASLIDVNGTLYGTTEYGGTHDNGTVYALKP